MTLYKWSTTAASNATADSTINWAEGQAPSSVNDSARALMAAVAKYRDEQSGFGVVTGGSSTAYTLTSHQGFTSLALMAGARISFFPHVTNGAAATLNVDGLGAKALMSDYPATALDAGSLLGGAPVSATYFNDVGGWVIHRSPLPPQMFPIGTVMPYAPATLSNTNYLLCNGQAVSRTTYATLFSLLSTTYGAGDAATTFNVPDLRGRVPAGNDTMGSSAASRLTVSYFGASGSTNGNTGGGESVTLLTANLASHTHTGTTGNNSADHTHTYSGTSSGASVGHTHSGTTDNANADHTHTGTTGNNSVDHTHTGTTGGVSVGHTHTYSGTTGDDSPDHTHDVSAATTTFSAQSGGGTTTRTSSLNGAITSAGASVRHQHSYSGTSAAQSADHTHTVTTGGVSANHTHTVTTGGMSATHQHAFTSGSNSVDHTHTYSGTSSGVSANHTHTFTSDATGSATPTAIVQPTIILNYIIRAL